MHVARCGGSFGAIAPGSWNDRSIATPHAWLVSIKKYNSVPTRNNDISIRYNATSSHRPSLKTIRIQCWEPSCLDGQAWQFHYFAHFGVWLFVLSAIHVPNPSINIHVNPWPMEGVLHPQSWDNKNPKRTRSRIVVQIEQNWKTAMASIGNGKCRVII